MSDLMDAIRRARAKAIVNLSNCPVCGARRIGGTGNPNGTEKAFFDCGSVFVTYGGEPIEPQVHCAGPSTLAAAHLNDELGAALAASKAGAA
ncbi:hypothetical protein [Ensifer soli]|uniref:hypothetical protein n=1 Tax=Ciceribacter sp. sgz301302 TaxID=3342379 RepID=UPI0035BB0078